MSIPKIKIRKFNPDILEVKRLAGYTPTIVILGKKGTGKCLSRDTQVMMFSGKFKAVQDIKIGDKLMGDDSTSRTVLSVCSGYDEMYNINQTKGDNYTTNGAHILSLKFYKGDKKGDVFDISVEDYLKLNQDQTKYLMGYKVPVNFPEKEIPTDPYTIGCMLGDSCDSGHVPDIYKYNSRAIQLKILAGLLDTNGKYNIIIFLQKI
jgi:hypothetical protein